MNSIFYFFGTYLPCLLDGVPVQFRIRPLGRNWKVESRGGKLGPFWGYAHFSSFEDRAEAASFAVKWATEAGGVLIEDKETSYHTHKTEDGLFVRCYHSSKNTLLSFNFWLGVTLSFPLDFIWTKVWPFAWITSYFGLLHD